MYVLMRMECYQKIIKSLAFTGLSVFTILLAIARVCGGATAGTCAASLKNLTSFFHFPSKRADILRSRSEFDQIIKQRAVFSAVTGEEPQMWRPGS
ncbi:MAG: hypothetical protein KAS74_02570 [Methanosarcinales archaeon]|nr:hypothetical protein [Methanosarcinales archaeon]